MMNKNKRAPGATWRDLTACIAQVTPLALLIAQFSIPSATFGQEPSIASVAPTGQRLAATVVGTFTKPPQRIPTLKMADGPLLGNGDLGIVVGGSADHLTFYLGKADFFGVLKGGMVAVGSLNLTIPELLHSSYHMEQNVGSARLTGEFSTPEGAKLSLTSWVAQKENLLVLELHNGGSKPLEISSQLLDGLGSPGNAATFAAQGDATSLRVSPDILDLELGNRLYGRAGEKPGTPESAFQGQIADFRIYDQSLPATSINAMENASIEKPFFQWSARNEAKLSGSAQINPQAPHGGSVVLDGSATSGLWLGALQVPQKQFTLSAWINPSAVPQGKSYIATACIDQNSGRAHGVYLSLIDGKLNITLNRTSLTAPNPVDLNQWTHVTATYDATTMTLYVNDQKMGSTTDFPGPDRVMGAERATIHFGDPQIPFLGCSPQGLIVQRLLGAEIKPTEHGLGFSLPPGAKATLVLAAVTDRNNPDYTQIAQKMVQDVDGAQLSELAQDHDTWWQNFWTKSFVEIPDKTIQDNWYASLYLLACCSRPDCPPPGLWGNFVTAPEMAWHGDYTLNYNYEAPFWAALAANHFELMDNYEKPLLDYLPRGRAIAKENHQQGLYYYMHLIPVPGWDNDGASFLGQKCETLFASVDCIMRWRYTHDPAYAQKIYPLLKETADFWDNYLVLKDGRYVDLNDAGGENKVNDNPATSLAFLRLLYPTLIELSGDLHVDSDRLAKWKDILARLSPLPIVPAATVDQMETACDPTTPQPPPGQKKQCNPKLTLLDLLGSTAVQDRMVIRNGETGWGFSFPMYKYYQDGNQRQSGPGMSSSQVIFPGWALGLESSAAEKKAALDTVTLLAHWYDFNDQCTFYPSAALAGYEPGEILANLHKLIVQHAYPNFVIPAGGGGTENFAVVPATLASMFLQSYQSNIHLFPDWPQDQDATFGNLPACGGFLVSSQQKQGKVSYVKITSQAGEICHLANPWPRAQVKITELNTYTSSSPLLNLPTKVGDTLLLTPSP